MRKVSILIALVFSCTNGDRTREVLEQQGYTNVEITGYRFNACSEHDSLCTGFTALSPAHHQVSGAVGCGRIQGCSKGCTIRID